MKKILPLALIFFYCAKPSEPSDMVVFNYSEKLMSKQAEITSDSISFQVPRDWTLADSTFTHLIDSTIYQNSGLVKKIFQDLKTESFLVYLEKLPYQLSQDSIDLNSGKWLALQYSDFTYNDLLIDQTVLQNETAVLFKMNIKKSINSIPKSSLHFFIPRKNISSHALMVESTIASFNN